MPEATAVRCWNTEGLHAVLVVLYTQEAFPTLPLK